jgi:hypothetical protein
MDKTSKIFIITLLGLICTLVFQVFYMYKKNALHVEEKNRFARLVKLPDLAISNSANFIRHRSLADTFSLFSNSPELLEYFPSTFTYNYSPIQYKNPSRIELEK